MNRKPNVLLHLGWMLVFLVAFTLSACSSCENNSAEKADKKKLTKEEQLEENLKKGRPDPDCQPTLKRSVLEQSMKFGRQFMLNNQKPAGNFNYEYDFVAKKQSQDDNAVRQAGAFWSMSLLHLHQPGDDTRAAFWKSFEFWQGLATTHPETGTFVDYAKTGSKDTRVALGTISLISLAIIDFLRAEPDLAPEKKETLIKALEGYLQYILTMQTPKGRFAGTMDPVTFKGGGAPNPYADGEALLALIKAVKYLNLEKAQSHYLPAFEKGLKDAVDVYVKKARKKNKDSDLTKGFFQWSIMAMWEYQDYDKEKGKPYRAVIRNLAYWMIDTHRMIKRGRNTAYALEGLLHAYQIAKAENNSKDAKYFRCAIDKVLYKLTSWQVMGPLHKETKLLADNPTEDPLAVGGVVNHHKEPGLRIDVTQHQMHVVSLALKYLYTQEGPTWP